MCDLLEVGQFIFGTNSSDGNCQTAAGLLYGGHAVQTGWCGLVSVNCRCSSHDHTWHGIITQREPKIVPHDRHMLAVSVDTANGAIDSPYIRPGNDHKDFGKAMHSNSIFLAHGMRALHRLDMEILL